MQPNPERGESSVIIDGEERIIKFSLGSQARVVAALEIDEISQIPTLMRTLDHKIIATMVSCSLVGEPQLSVEQLLECSVPTQPAIMGISTAIDLCTWGTAGPPQAQDDDEGKAETGQEMMM